MTVASFCRNCGKALTDQEKSVPGTIYCAGCAPAWAGGSYASAPPPLASAQSSTSPGLAFLLGLIPGVGAIYNGQYAKGLMHVFIFGVLISITESGRDGGGQALLAMMTAGFYFYMPFEAYHTARRQQLGLPVDEFSSLVPLKGHAGGHPVGPVLLIAVGVVFLLNNLNLLPIGTLLRFWPVGLIALGVYMLRDRMRQQQQQPLGPGGFGGGPTPSGGSGSPDTAPAHSSDELSRRPFGTEFGEARS